LLAQNTLRAPQDTAENLVNAASNVSGPVAPHSIATLYGENLSWVTRGIRPDDLRGDMLPNVLLGTGVRVLVGGLAAAIYYVSPTQVNLLIPSELIAGRHQLEVVRDGVAGPRISIVLQAESPEIFITYPERWVAATRADGSAITPGRPAQPGETIVLYATGLGRTRPDSLSGQVASIAAPIIRRPEFRVWLDGRPGGTIHYSGLTPGFGGLYQINLQLPADVGTNPEIRCGFLEAPSSQPGVRLAVSPAPPAP
jgi:uncharacterized protein (TIGR03437 family)